MKIEKDSIHALVAIGKSLGSYLRKDQKASYPLVEQVAVTVQSRRVAALFDRDFTTADSSLSILQRGGDLVRIVAHPFPAEAHLWNGPDLIPNDTFPAMLASLFHDLIWEHAAEIAAFYGSDTATVLRRGNDILYLVWRKAGGSRSRAWGAFQAVSLAVPWYHRLKKLLGAVALCLSLGAAGCAGCAALPDGEALDIENGEHVQSIMDQFGDGLE